MTSQKNPAAFVLLALLLLTSTSHVDISRGAEARPLTITKQQKYVKVLESLGLMCQCCDGEGGDCRSTWDSNCAKLDCRPWKFS